MIILVVEILCFLKHVVSHISGPWLSLKNAAFRSLCSARLKYLMISLSHSGFSEAKYFPVFFLVRMIHPFSPFCEIHLREKGGDFWLACEYKSPWVCVCVSARVCAWERELSPPKGRAAEWSIHCGIQSFKCHIFSTPMQRLKLFLPSWVIGEQDLIQIGFLIEGERN